MKVSVVIITYNQEKYIAQAIESALMQNVNFNYEILVGDDCSTDFIYRVEFEIDLAEPPQSTEPTRNVWIRALRDGITMRMHTILPT